MKILSLKRSTVALIAVVLPLLFLFIYVAFRSGPLAPTAVTVTTVESRALTPALFGIGTVQARYTYKIGSTFAGRLKRLDVHVGDTVNAGQVLGEIDPVDMDERITAQQAAVKSSQAVFAQAQARLDFAQTQASRYEQLLAAQGISEESTAAKRQELAIANAALAAAREDTLRIRADLEALRTLRGNLRLVAPAAGVVIAREAEPGTTVVAGQSVVEVVDPMSVWIDTRFDQVSADGLRAGLPAQISLRSRQSQALSGRLMRIEPRADAVTEETLAKVVFVAQPTALLPLGELAEVTVQLGDLPAAPTIPNAALRTVNGQRGVWKLSDGDLVFAPITLGGSDLEGHVQVLKGVKAGERVIVYSDKILSSRSRIHIVETLTRGAP